MDLAAEIAKLATALLALAKVILDLVFEHVSSEKRKTPDSGLKPFPCS